MLRPLAKNISITQNGTTRTGTASKIKVNLVGGGTATFIPEDEAEAAIEQAQEAVYSGLLTAKWGSNRTYINTTWVFGDSLTAPASEDKFTQISISSGESTYSGIAWYASGGGALVYGATTVYAGGHWLNADYKQITILTEPSDEWFTVWLEANAQEVVE